MESFERGVPLGKKALARNGMKTGDNAEFLRLWWEINNTTMNTKAFSLIEAQTNKAKWYPYNKGGGYRKWFGNDEYVVNWENCGERVIGRAKLEKRFNFLILTEL